jgi:hypothetical protein
MTRFKPVPIISPFIPPYPKASTPGRTKAAYNSARYLAAVIILKTDFAYHRTEREPSGRNWLGCRFGRIAIEADPLSLFKALIADFLISLTQKASK